MDGVPEIGAVEARAAAERGELVLVDVREDREWDAGRAPAARHVPLSQLDDRWAELRAQDAPLAFICRVGQRSAVATLLSRRSGIEAVNVAGGMQAWQAAGLPLTPPGGYVA